MVVIAVVVLGKNGTRFWVGKLFIKYKLKLNCKKRGQVRKPTFVNAQTRKSAHAVCVCVCVCVVCVCVCVLLF